MTAHTFRVGDVIPEWSLPLTPTTIVSTAIATRDWQDVHHDRDIAQAAGSKDIFMNILTSNGLVEKYVVPLRSSGALADELLVSVRVYLEHGGRRDAAARALHLHPNTLGYRIGRFAQFTGADLEDHQVLAELWWLCRHLEVVGTPPASSPET